MFLYEPWNPTVLSDVLEFTASGQQYITVYSMVNGQPLTPPTLDTNQYNYVSPISLTEVTLPSGYIGLVYTPTAGEPGYGANITFTFTSESETSLATPDGGTTVALLGTSLLALAVLRRKLRFS